MIKISINTTYSGKTYSNISDAIMQSAADQLKDRLMEDIQPFRDEIEFSKGEVDIVVASDLSNVNFEFRNISQDLEDRIMGALNN